MLSPLDTDECLETLVCGSGGTCTNVAGAYQCDCDEGYKLNGVPTTGLSMKFRCENENECKTDRESCPDGDVCLDTDGSYECCHDDNEGMPAVIKAIYGLDLANCNQAAEYCGDEQEAYHIRWFCPVTCGLCDSFIGRNEVVIITPPPGQSQDVAVTQLATEAPTTGLDLTKPSTELGTQTASIKTTVLVDLTLAMDYEATDFAVLKKVISVAVALLGAKTAGIDFRQGSIIASLSFESAADSQLVATNKETLETSIVRDYVLTEGFCSPSLCAVGEGPCINQFDNCRLESSDGITCPSGYERCEDGVRPTVNDLAAVAELPEQKESNASAGGGISTELLLVIIVAIILLFVGIFVCHAMRKTPKQVASLSGAIPSSSAQTLYRSAGSTGNQANSEPQIAPLSSRSSAPSPMVINGHVVRPATPPILGGYSNSRTAWSAGNDTSQLFSDFSGLGGSSDADFEVHVSHNPVSYQLWLSHFQTYRLYPTERKRDSLPLGGG